MPYQRHNFMNGAILFANQLNEMEDGIVDNENNITQLSNDISDVGIILPHHLTVTRGVYDSSYNITTSNNRAVTELFSADVGMIVKKIGGNKYATLVVRSYGQTSSESESTSWNQNETATIKTASNTTFVVIKKIDNTIFTDNDIAEINNVMSYRNPEDDISKNPEVCYVSVDGNDNNIGTSDKPFRTIQHGIDIGANTIYVKPGTYTESLRAESKEVLQIFPWGYESYTSGNLTPKIVIDATGHDNGIFLMAIRNLEISCVEVHHSTASSIRCLNIMNAHFKDVHVHHTSKSASCGFELINVNGIFDNCVAHDVVLDGFNIHGYGNTVFNDCIGYNNGDDGISHHDGCTGTINGGEYYGNVQGGISSPAYGAIVDIYNAYCHDNTRYGIYAPVLDGYVRDFKIFGCVIVNNGVADLQIGNRALVYNTKYNTHGGSGTIVQL